MSDEHAEVEMGTSNEIGRLQNEVDRLTAQKDALTASLTAVSAEKNEWQRKFLEQDDSEELALSQAICEKLSARLDAIAIAVAVNGPEPPLVKWSFHDLPEKVAAVSRRLAQVTSALEKYGQHTADCATRTELQFDTGRMGVCDCGFAEHERHDEGR